MKKRYKMKKSQSKRLFTKTASRTRRKNLRQDAQVGPMRGGTRL